MGNDISHEQPTRKPKLLEQVRELAGQILLPPHGRGYSGWIRRFILSQQTPPREMGGVEVARFLSHLAAVQDVSPSTQNQAFSAILFLYRDALRKPLDDPGPVKRAQRERKVPVMAH